MIAYSTCIAHGFDMADSMGHQKLAVNSGHWPLYRYRPAAADGAPFQLDSKAPSIPFGDFAQKEARFAMLFRSDPRRAKELLAALGGGHRRAVAVLRAAGRGAARRPAAGPGRTTCPPQR